MSKISYSDRLIEITDTVITVRNYYYPFGSKRIHQKDIESITVHSPTLLSGKYRYWGTGDFRTWFPPDNRSLRDKIFVIKLKKKWWRIGFTVEDSQRVLAVIKDQCTIIDKSIE